jgi:DNA modification methylase
MTGKLEAQREVPLNGRSDHIAEAPGQYDPTSNRHSASNGVRLNKLNDLEAREWIAETKSIWFQKGLGASHPEAAIERQHPAPFSYQDVMRLIRFFTKRDQKVLDPFLGVGSTLKACDLSGRAGVGIETEKLWVELARQRLREEVDPGALERQEIIHGDAREVMTGLADRSFNLVVTSPPYWGILSKPPDHKAKNGRVQHGLAVDYGGSSSDLAKIESYPAFLSALSDVFAECLRVLEVGGHLCVIVSDFRHGRRLIPYHADVNAEIGRLRWRGSVFELQGITILAQNQKRLFPYGYPSTYVPNIHHQNILTYRKYV